MVEQLTLPGMETPGDAGTRELSEWLKTHKIVDVHRYDARGNSITGQMGYSPGGHDVVVLADTATRNPGITEEKASTEIGTALPSPFLAPLREEWVGELRGKDGLQRFYRMTRSDGMIVGALRRVKGPILAGHWFVKPATQSTRDVNVAELIENNLFKHLNVAWPALLQDILLMCNYGVMPFEKVWYEPGAFSDGKMRLRKLAPRHPIEVKEWNYDPEGGPNGITMEPQGPGGPDEEPIPIEKLAIFSLDAEAGDLQGTSLLRPAYKHWFYREQLYKIDAIQKERHGIGVPIIRLPPGFTDADRRIAEELGRNLRTNDRAHVVLPPLWDLGFAKLEGHMVDAMKSIEHHGKMIEASIMAPFLQSDKPSEEVITEQLKWTRQIAGVITAVFNRHVIPQMVDFNFQRVGYPTLEARRIGEWEDVRTMSFALRNFVGARLIRPDQKLEDFLRQEIDIPAADPATARLDPREAAASAAPGQPQQPQVAAGGSSPTPPGPPRVGPPRQQQLPPGGVSRTNAGLPRS